MKSLKEHINESSMNVYEIYFSYSKKSIAINALHDNTLVDVNSTYKTIDDAVKAIYKVDAICEIRLIPSVKFANFMTK